MGRAAALDMIVGRRDSDTKELLFDRNYEIIIMGEDGMPVDWMVTDHAGSFVNYDHDLDEYVAQYANVARRRRGFVSNYAEFVDSYVNGFADALFEAQANYRAKRKAFDHLFVDRPFDTNGSGAYRWARTLERLDRADPDKLAEMLRRAIGPAE